MARRTAIVPITPQSPILDVVPQQAGSPPQTPTPIDYTNQGRLLAITDAQIRSLFTDDTVEETTAVKTVPPIKPHVPPGVQRGYTIPPPTVAVVPPPTVAVVPPLLRVPNPTKRKVRFALPDSPEVNFPVPRPISPDPGFTVPRPVSPNPDFIVPRPASPGPVPFYPLPTVLPPVVQPVPVTAPKFVLPPPTVVAPRPILPPPTVAAPRLTLPPPTVAAPRPTVGWTLPPPTVAAPRPTVH